MTEAVLKLRCAERARTRIDRVARRLLATLPTAVKHRVDLEVVRGIRARQEQQRLVSQHSSRALARLQVEVEDLAGGKRRCAGGRDRDGGDGEKSGQQDLRSSPYHRVPHERERSPTPRRRPCP